MTGDEDDYLSDKFLVPSTASTSNAATYSDRRKEAQRRAQAKNEQNRHKSRRQLELESREEGLSKSLFERAKEQQSELGGSENKAMAMMTKMGFKPGQSLGKTADELLPGPVSLLDESTAAAKSAHKTEPLPLNEWEGRKGIGNRKRALSPTAAERMAKMAKMAETWSQTSFRDRAKQDYAEKRAEGQLVSAQRTCATLDQEDNKMFNILWLNPTNPDFFPRGLMNALETQAIVARPLTRREAGSIEMRLREQMGSETLRPLEEYDTFPEKGIAADPEYAPDVLEEAGQFLGLQAQDQLQLVLSYLRDKYAYCFWCGTRYEDNEEMASSCPGVKEDDH